MKLGAVAFVAVAFLSGCDIMFTNVFEKLAPLKVPSASELSTLSTDEIQRLAEDPDFFDQLADDPAKQAAVLDNLDDKFSDGTADTPEEQKAAALYAEIQLKTSGADDVIARLIGVLTGGDGFDQLDTDPSVLLADLFEESLPTPEEIQAMVTALHNSWAAYNAIGAGLGTSSLDESLNAGDIAMSAALAAALEGIERNNVQLSSEELSNYIYDSIQGNDLAGYGSVTFNDSYLMGDAIDNLLSAAGLDPSDMGL